MSETPPTLDDVLGLLREFTRNSYPGEKAVRFILDFASGEQLRMPLPVVRSTEQHSLEADGLLLRWYGREYRFTPNQALAIQVLYEAFVAGRPEVPAAKLLEEAGSKSNRLSDLFKRSPAWDDGVISKAGNGLVALYAPEE